MGDAGVGLGSVNLKGLESVLKEREDYFQAMADRCRQIGIQLFVTVRMNDAHDSPKGWNAVDLYSQYKKAHPELLLGEAVHPSFATGFDFAYEQVRQNKFKVIEEIVLDYDLDGIELDFLRHPAFFKPEEAYRNRHLKIQQENVGALPGSDFLLQTMCREPPPRASR